MKYLTLTAAATALLFAPATANAQLFGSGFDTSSVFGGLGGAGIGAGLGSAIAGSGNRTEGAAIGAALGGLAGVSYGNSRSTFGGNPYAGSFNPGFSGNSLLGTAAGAGIGGVIGSNLAGSGVQQEGTAIGAVVGGLAGYALTNRSSRYGNQGVGAAGFGGGNVIPAGFGGGSSRYGSPVPSLGGGFVPPSYGPGFGAPSFGAPAFGAPIPQFGAGLPSAPFGGPSFVPGGLVNVGTFANTTTIRQAPQPIYVEKVIRQPAPRPAPPQTIVVKHRYVAPTPAPQQVIVKHRYVASPPAPQKVIVKHVYEQAPAPAPQPVVIRHEYEQATAPAPQQPVVSHEYYNAPAPSLAVAPTIAPAPDAGAGGSYLVSGGQSFQAPSAGEFAARCAGGAGTCSPSYANTSSSFVDTLPVAPTISQAYDSGAADCATSTFGCAGSYETGPSYSQSTSGYASQAGGYSYCGSDKVYNKDGALLIGASPVCRN